MAKVYKVQIYISDYNDEIQDVDNLKTRLEDLGDRMWVGIKIADYKESKEFEWHDDLLINKTYAQVDDYEKYFE